MEEDDPLPPREVDSSEIILSGEEALNAPFSEHARAVARSKKNIEYEADLESEIVTRSEKYGTIFRYPLTYHPAASPAETETFAILVIWSEDGKTGKIVSRPTFQMPE